MSEYDKPIATLRAIESERELTANEEARLIALLRCKAEDEATDNGTEIENGIEFEDRIMSRVTFTPKDRTDYYDGWPEKVIGDGFDLKLWEVSYTESSAIYRDNFREEYEFFDPSAGEWTANIREDG